MHVSSKLCRDSGFLNWGVMKKDGEGMERGAIHMRNRQDAVG